LTFSWDQIALINIKDLLNLIRLAVSSEKSLDGKLFVQFMVLIFLSCITKKMQKSKLSREYRLHEVLDAISMIECFEVPGRKLQTIKATMRQLDLYTKLDITPPASLQ